MTTETTVTRELVPEDQRLIITEKLFGVHFPLQLEPVIYGITERMAEDYTAVTGSSGRSPTAASTWHRPATGSTTSSATIVSKVTCRPTLWGLRPVCMLTATCLSPTATSPGSMHVTITGCERSWSSTPRSERSWARRTEHIPDFPRCPYRMGIGGWGGRPISAFAESPEWAPSETPPSCLGMSLLY